MSELTEKAVQQVGRNAETVAIALAAIAMAEALERIADRLDQAGF